MRCAPLAAVGLLLVTLSACSLQRQMEFDRRVAQLGTNRLQQRASCEAGRFMADTSTRIEPLASDDSMQSPQSHVELIETAVGTEQERLTEDVPEPPVRLASLAEIPTHSDGLQLTSPQQEAGELPAPTTVKSTPGERSEESSEGTAEPNELFVPSESIADESFSLEQIEQLAMQNHPTLFQADANVTASQGQYQQAGLYPNTRFGYSHNEINAGGAGGQAGFYLAQEFIRGNKLQLQQHAEFHRYLAAISAREIQQLRLLTSVRTRFWELLTTQRRLTLLEELAKINRSGTSQLQALFDAGQTTQIAVLQARVQLEQTELELQKARNNYEAAWQRLAAMINRPDLEPRPVTGDLDAAIAEINPDTLFDRILAESPEINRATERVQQARATLERQIAEPIPNIDIQGTLQHDDATNDTIASVNMELPLPILNRNQGNIQSARAELISASQELDRLRLELKSRYADATRQYSNALAEAERYRDRIVPDAEETLKLLNQAYQTEGQIEFLQLLLAQQTNYDTQLSYLNSLQQLRIAETELTGLLLVGGLQRPAAY